jgi:hypothetical protein
MGVMFPSASGSANAAFNPSRYYAEVGQTAQSIPGSSVYGQGNLGQSMRSIYLPMLVVVVLLWALERRRIKAMAK